MCECYKIGGPFIAEDPDCPVHGHEAREELRSKFRELSRELRDEIQRLRTEIRQLREEFNKDL